MEILERQYARALDDVLKNGKLSSNRTGKDTISLQHKYFYVKNAKYDFPLIKGKKIFPEKALIEYMWFLNGKTNVNWLKERNVNYWDSWADENGEIGRSYGYQFRKWLRVKDQKPIESFDQFTYVINQIMENPDSRRIIINLWNIEDLKLMNLPPCVLYYQFNVETSNNINYIDMHVICRSQDSFLGFPYDIIGASYFLNIVAEICSFLSENKYEAREIHYTANDFHIYTNHIVQVKKYLSNVSKNKNNIIDAVTELKIDNSILINSEEHINKKTLKNILNIWDDNDYDCFKLIKNWKDEDVYDFIPAQVAV